MNNAFTATATYNGKPLSVLADLIRQRQALLGETAKDSAAAAAINVMTSLRADTKAASIRGKRLQIRRNTGFTPGWVSGAGSGASRRWLVARPSGGGSPHVKAIVTPGVDSTAIGRKGQADSAYPVFDYFIDRDGPVTTRLIIARDEADAMAHAPAVQRVLKHAGLAKRIWGVMMSEISGREPSAQAGEGSRAGAVARANQSVAVVEVDGSISINIHDRLAYAKDALRSGVSAIDQAVMKASNKISGQLQQYVKSHFSFGETVGPTPFPEVARRRK